MYKKFTLILPVFLIASCAPISKVNLSDFYTHFSNHRDEVFCNEITEYSGFENLNILNKSYIIYIYNDPNCMCYDDLKRISADIVVDYSLLVYTMDEEIIRGKNTYGYSIDGHDYPSICIYDNGRLHSTVHYNEVEYFESQEKYCEWLFARINIQ